MTMKKMMDMPKNLCKEVKMAAETTYLEREVLQKMKNGTSLTAIAMEYLPAGDKEKIEADMLELEKGVYFVYEQKNAEMDAQSVEQYLNHALGHQKNDKCIAHLTNINAIIGHLVDLDPEERITAEDAAKVEAIKQKQKKDITDEDVAFVLKVTQQLLSNNAGVLAQNSVRALDKMMPYLTEEVVTEIADKGIDNALAYGLACYIMQNCGKDPWGMEENVAEQTPEAIGVIAATNVEASKLLALYCKGKIGLRMLQDKLKQLYTIVYSFVYKYGYIMVAVGIFAFLYTAQWGIWESIFGTLVLTVLVKEVVNTINFLWSEIKCVYNVFFKKEEKNILDETAVVEVDETVNVTEENSNYQEDSDSDEAFAF